MGDIIDLNDKIPQVIARRMAAHLEGKQLTQAMLAIALLCKGLTESMKDQELEWEDLENFKASLTDLISDQIADI